MKIHFDFIKEVYAQNLANLFLSFLCTLIVVFFNVNYLIAQCEPIQSANTFNYTVCEGTDIPIFEVDETITNTMYQLHDDTLESIYGSGSADTPFTWGNMFQINADDCIKGCSFVSFEASFGNAQGDTVSWHIYNDDDGDPRSGLSTSLASGNHVVINNASISNNVLDNIVANNIDICANIDTMPYLFISFSYIGNSLPASIDTTSTNMQSWISFTADGTQTDWADNSTSLIGETVLSQGNWLINANLTCPPCTINWYDAPLSGNILGSGNNFDPGNQISEEGTTIDNTSIGSTYTYYAERQCNTCVSANRQAVTITVEDCCPVDLNFPMGTYDYIICEADSIPIFEVDETTTNIMYQLHDDTLESIYGSGNANVPYTWGNMFEINADDCVIGCSFLSFEASFGNAQGDTVIWHIYNDDDGDPRSGLSSPLASGNHVVVNNASISNNVLDNIVANNIDICADINTMPYLFISFSYIGTSFPASIDTTSTNMQSWVSFTADGTQTDWSDSSTSLVGETSLTAGNWLINANLTCPPCTITWYDAPLSGNILGTGNNFDPGNQVSEEGTTIDNSSIGSTYTYYAERQCNTCVSASRQAVTLTVEDCCPDDLNFPMGTYDYNICEADSIPIFEVNETTTNTKYQLDDGTLESIYGTGNADTPYTWGNMFEINADDCVTGCSFISFEASFGNAQGDTVSWHIYNDDDGDPRSGLSAPLASGNHVVVNNASLPNNVLDSIVVNNIDICADIRTMPYLFISFSYQGTSFPASIDTTSANMQSWVSFTADGTQSDWSDNSTSLVGETSLSPGNWLINANLTCPPCTINWYDAPLSGNLLGSGNNFDPSNQVSEEGTIIDNSSIDTTYTYYAERQCNTCVGAGRQAVTLTVEDCCIDELNFPITITHTMDQVFEAGTNITSAAQVSPDAMVTYRADTIRLRSGFSVSPNNSFRAEIGGCD